MNSFIGLVVVINTRVPNQFGLPGMFGCGMDQKRIITLPKIKTIKTMKMEEHNNMINVGQRAEMDHQEFKKNHAWTESSLSLYPNYPLYNVVVILFAYFTSPHLLALLHYNHRPFFKKVKIN